RPRWVAMFIEELLRGVDGDTRSRVSEPPGRGTLPLAGLFVPAIPTPQAPPPGGIERPLSGLRAARGTLPLSARTGTEEQDDVRADVSRTARPPAEARRDRSRRAGAAAAQAPLAARAHPSRARAGHPPLGSPGAVVRPIRRRALRRCGGRSRDCAGRSR